MRHTVERSKSKAAVSSVLVQGKCVGRYARLRIPHAAMRHTEVQLIKVVRALDRWRFPPVIVGVKGEVLAGFGQAQVANQHILGRGVWTTNFSQMTNRNIRDYITWMKEIALRGNWDKQMVAIETQYLKKAK